jgi:hypothetical protein
MAVFVGGPLDRQVRELDPAIERHGVYEFIQCGPMPAPEVMFDESKPLPEELVIATRVTYVRYMLFGEPVWALNSMPIETILAKLLNREVMRLALSAYVERKG